MPFPLVPIFIGLGALLTGAFGAKKGLDAKRDFNSARDMNNSAKAAYDDEAAALDLAREETNAKLERLGKTRVQCFEGSISRFVDAFSRIQNVEVSPLAQMGDLGISTEELGELKRTAIQMTELAQGIGGSLGGGALAGVAAYGSVGLLASTAGGTAIAGLSGAAAKGATLAWIGGGSLAAGGFGIAGGTAILGGIVAAPVLLIGGLLAAAKAEEALENARSNRAQARAAVEQMAAAKLQLDAIMEGANLLHEETIFLRRRFLPAVLKLEHVVEETDDWQTMGASDRCTVERSVMFAKAMKIILDAPVLNKKGEVNKAIAKVVKQAQDLVVALDQL